MFDWKKTRLNDMYQHVVLYPLYSSTDEYLHVQGKDARLLEELDTAFGGQLKIVSDEDLSLMNTSFWGREGTDFKIPLPFSRKGLIDHGYFDAKSIFSENAPTFKTVTKDIAILMHQYVLTCKDNQYRLKYGEKMHEKMKAKVKDTDLKSAYGKFKEVQKKQQDTDFFWNISNEQRTNFEETLKHGHLLFPSSLEKMTKCTHSRAEIVNGKVQCLDCRLLVYRKDDGEVALALDEGLEMLLQRFQEIQAIQVSPDRKRAFIKLLTSRSLYDDACEALLEMKELSMVIRGLVSKVPMPANSKTMYGLLKFKPLLEGVKASLPGGVESVPNKVAIPVLDLLSLDKGVQDFLESPAEFVERAKDNVAYLKKELERQMKAVGQSVQIRHLMGIDLPLEKAINVLKFVESLDGKYGITTLADVLAGSKVKKMYDFKLDKHQFYGYLHDKTGADVLQILNRLLDKKVVVKVGYDYPKLHLTDIGKEILYFSTVPTLTYEEQIDQYLKQSFSQVFAVIGNTKKELLDAYIERNFSATTPKQYRKMLDRLKTQNEDVLYEKMFPYMIKEYRNEYAPVFEFIITSKAGSKYGAYVKRIYQVAKEGEAEHVS